MTRNTIQKSMVLESVRGMINHPTADEVYEAVLIKCPNISKGTVYRNLNLLAESGEIRRVEVANAPDRFDFTTAPHAHFKCIKCGKVYDYNLRNAIIPENELNPGMTVEDAQLVFTGVCKSCNEKQQIKSERH